MIRPWSRDAWLWLLCAVAMVLCSASQRVHGQDRFSIEPLGWSFVPPAGWAVIDARTLAEIERDLRTVSATTTLHAGYALREQGSLPRLLVSGHVMQLGTPQAAAEFVASLGGTEAALLEDSMSFSSSTSMPHGVSDVLVLTEGFVGAKGVVMLVVYAREDDLEAARGALAMAASTARFDDDSALKSEEVLMDAGGGDGQSPTLDESGGTQAGQPVGRWARIGQWGVRGAVVGAMIAVILFGLRFLKIIWTTGAESEKR